MTSLHCMQCITSLCNASSLIDNYHDDHGMMMARRVSADWAHKCWAPVLAAAAAVSGPDTRSSGKYDAKLSTQPRGESQRPHHDGWSPGPGDRVQRKPSGDRESPQWQSHKLFLSPQETILYGAIKILVMDRSFYPGIYKNVALLGQEITTSVPGLNIA